MSVLTEMRISLAISALLSNPDTCRSTSLHGKITIYRGVLDPNHACGGLVSLTIVTEHDLVPRGDGGPLASRRLPALTPRLLAGRFR